MGRSAGPRPNLSPDKTSVSEVRPILEAKGRTRRHTVLRRVFTLSSLPAQACSSDEIEEFTGIFLRKASSVREAKKLSHHLKREGEKIPRSRQLAQSPRRELRLERNERQETSRFYTLLPSPWLLRGLFPTQQRHMIIGKLLGLPRPCLELQFEAGGAWGYHGEPGSPKQNTMFRTLGSLVFWDSV